SQPGGRLTVTLGLAAFPADAEDGLALLDVADRALYLGKQQGGNRVAVLPRPDATPRPSP
ncbi:MAG TPA: GGDEF domain-containing protein, partial [Candidatus Methylomirabilis sp.]|nr:GGDEF domain-containing protein [Candidatus Methylomirabilis sp.]